MLGQWLNAIEPSPRWEETKRSLILETKASLLIFQKKTLSKWMVKEAGNGTGGLLFSTSSSALSNEAISTQSAKRKISILFTFEYKAKLKRQVLPSLLNSCFTVMVTAQTPCSKQEMSKYCQGFKLLSIHCCRGNITRDSSESKNTAKYFKLRVRKHPLLSSNTLRIEP